MNIFVGITLLVVGLFLIMARKDVRIRKFCLEFTEGKDCLDDQKFSNYILPVGIILILGGFFAIFATAFKQVLGSVLVIIGVVSLFHKYNESVMDFIGRFFDHKYLNMINNILMWPVKTVRDLYIIKSDTSNSWLTKIMGLPLVVVGLLTIMMPLPWFYVASIIFIALGFALTWKKDLQQNVSEAIIMGHSMSNESFAVMIFVDGPGNTSPENRVIVQKGGSLTISFTPDPGCAVKTVFIDGMPTQGYNREANSYTFSNVTEKHAIRVEFASPSGNA